MKPRKKRSLREEEQARDEAIERVSGGCRGLVHLANDVARKIAREEGKVTSPQVWKTLWEMAVHDEKLKVELEGSDPRWMGAVFHTRRWHRIGWESTGSHKRPVSVWQLQPELVA